MASILQFPSDRPARNAGYTALIVDGPPLDFMQAARQARRASAEAATATANVVALADYRTAHRSGMRPDYAPIPA